jgi:hypothetical protein
MKVPRDWPNLTRVFSKDYVHMKLSELLAFCGGRGQYLVGLTDISDKCKKLFVRLLKTAGEFIRVVKTAVDAQAVHERLVEVLTELEIALPIFWCTMTRHILLHMQYFVKMFGSFRCWNMLPVERFHVLLKSMMCSTKSLFVGLDNSYQRYIVCQDREATLGLQDKKARRKSVSLI